MKAVKLVFRTKEDKTTPARVRSIWQEFKSVCEYCQYPLLSTLADPNEQRIIRAFKKDAHPNIIRFYDL